jgi:hypothetical protein
LQSRARRKNRVARNRSVGAHADDAALRGNVGVDADAPIHGIG